MLLSLKLLIFKKPSPNYYLKKIQYLSSYFLNNIENINSNQLLKLAKNFDNLMDNFFQDYYYLYINSLNHQEKKETMIQLFETTAHIDLGVKCNNCCRLKTFIQINHDREQFNNNLAKYFNQNLSIMHKLILSHKNRELKNEIGLLSWDSDPIHRGFAALKRDLTIKLPEVKEANRL